MATLTTFSTRINTIVVGMNRNIDKTVKDAASTVLRSMVDRIPIDTGAAKSNTQVSLGTPILTTRAAHAPGVKRSTEQQNISAAINAGQRRINSRRKEAIFITNNIPYIGKLNRGTSTQSPGLFAEVAVVLGLLSVKRARVLRRSTIGALRG